MSQTIKIVDGVTGYMAKEFKNVKPFDKNAVSPKEQQYWYDQLSREDMGYLIQKHGSQKVNEFIYKMESLKEKGR